MGLFVRYWELFLGSGLLIVWRAVVCDACDCVLPGPHLLSPSSSWAGFLGLGLPLVCTSVLPGKGNGKLG